MLAGIFMPTFSVFSPLYPFLALFILLMSFSFFFLFILFDWRGVVASMRWTNI